MRVAGRVGNLVFAVALAAVGAACGGDGEGPVIDEIQPASAMPGDTVEVLGDRFCGDSDADADAEGTCVENVAALVNFGEDQSVIRASISSYGHTRITVEVPPAAPSGATVVVVLRGGVPSNAADFDIL